MYNLLVTAAQGAWDGSDYVLSRERYLEHTEEDIRRQFASLDSDTIKKLTTIPTLFAYESPVDAPARVGWLETVQVRGRDIRITFQFDPAIPEISTAELESLVWDLQIGGMELNRTHFAVKSADLLAVLSASKTPARVPAAPPYRKSDFLYISAQPSDRTISFAPHVFKVPEGNNQRDLVALMMPFSRDFDGVRVVVKEACQDLKLRCIRADDMWQDAVIIQDIFNLLFWATVVVVDFSKKNPNVMYETGIAHTLGKVVVPICQSLDDLPFDMRHHRALQYLPNREGLAELKKRLGEKLSQFSKRQ